MIKKSKDLNQLVCGTLNKTWEIMQRLNFCHHCLNFHLDLKQFFKYDRAARLHV